MSYRAVVYGGGLIDMNNTNNSNQLNESQDFSSSAKEFMIVTSDKKSETVADEVMSKDVEPLILNDHDKLRLIEWFCIKCN